MKANNKGRTAFNPPALRRQKGEGHFREHGMRSLPRAVLALGLGLLAAPHAIAARPSPAPVKTETSVTIPFAPTLGKSLLLRSERRVINVRGNVETPSEETTSEDELVFTERNADGYILRWTTKSVSVRTSPEKQALLEKVMSAAVGKSALIQTDAQGAPVAVLNIADMRSLLASAFDTVLSSVDTHFASKPQAEREFLRKTFAGLAGMYRGMTDAQLSELILEDPRMLLGFGGAALTPGRAAPFKTSITLPIVNTPLDVAGHVELRETSPDELTIATSSASNPADVKVAAAAYLEKALAGLDAARRDTVLAAVNKLEGFELTDELVLTLDAKSGIVRRANYRKRSGLREQSRLEIKSYTCTD